MKANDRLEVLLAGPLHGPWKAYRSLRGWFTYRLTGQQRLVYTAGFGLILAGILCLCLSGAVVTGWWQGTLDAFGVGFAVGGVVDVLAISGLNQVISGEAQRRQGIRRGNNRRAEEFLRSLKAPETPEEGRGQAAEAVAILVSSGRELDEDLQRRLRDIDERYPGSFWGTPVKPKDAENENWPFAPNPRTQAKINEPPPPGWGKPRNRKDAEQGPVSPNPRTQAKVDALFGDDASTASPTGQSTGQPDTSPSGT